MNKRVYQEKTRLTHVRLNSGGYDDRGAYFGNDYKRVYRYFIANSDLAGEIRAHDREDAKRILKNLFPTISIEFYN